MNNIFIIAGEVSGDSFAAELMSKIKEKQDTTFYGCGGQKMKDQGLHSIAEDNSLLSAIGYIEAIGFVFKHLKILNSLIKNIKKYNCNEVILVDHEVFNIIAAKKIRKAFGNTVKIYFYIAPRVSMWGAKSAPTIAKVCDAIFCYMQPDLPIYQKYTPESYYFGNPLAKRLKTFVPSKNFYEEHNLNRQHEYIAILPGSRKQEIKELLPVFIQTALRLHLERNSRFLLPIAHKDLTPLIEKTIKSFKAQHCIQIINDSALNIMSHCELGLVSAGTATLEAVMMKMYPIISYKVSEMTFKAIKSAEKLGDETLIGLPNVFLQQRIFPEILQFEVTYERLYQECLYYLNMSKEVKQYIMNDAYDRLYNTLGKIDSVDQVADYIIEHSRVFNG